MPGHQEQDSHLGWSDKQRRILTAHGQAVVFYTAERGFAFQDTELPHHHMMLQDTHVVFDEWKTKQEDDTANQSTTNIVVGAWKRPLFYGGWEYSTAATEDCFNLQTNTLFVDLRLPTTRQKTNNTTSSSSLDNMTGEELCHYARQHIFAGYTQRVATPPRGHKKNISSYPLVCTRHHCLDWNFTGTPRNRPNKWWVEPDSNSKNLWKEWAYATDKHGQHYYCEIWQRLEHPSTSNGNDDYLTPVVALRKRVSRAQQDRDGVLVIVGDHFNFCLGRQNAPQEICSSLVDAVDAAVKKGELDVARQWLSMEGGHGRVSNGWVVDAAINYWIEGKPLWTRNELDVVPEGNGSTLIWKGQPWDVFESNVKSPEGLKALLTTGLS